MTKDEFEENLNKISSSFQSSRASIGAGSSIWKIHQSELHQIAGVLNQGGSVTKAQLKALQKIWVSNVPFLDEKGKPFVLYIRDHSHQRRYGGNDFRKFHVAQCRTLDEMGRGGRSDRYFKKGDIDNPEFFITFSETEVENKRLEVCKNCLNYMSSEKGDNRFNVNTFDMVSFFELYSKTNLKPATRRPGVSDYYPADWTERSSRIREEANWICQDCGKSFINNKSDLHVHHKSGVPGNSHRSNLEVVCSDCHANKFAHGHMKRPAKSLSESRENVSSALTTGERNKFDAFANAPEKYATGSAKTSEKVQFLVDVMQKKDGGMTNSDKEKFEMAIKKYREILSVK